YVCHCSKTIARRHTYRREEQRFGTRLLQYSLIFSRCRCAPSMLQCLPLFYQERCHGWHPIALHRQKNERILLVNLLQSSRSTFPWGSFLSFFAFQEDMLSTPISALGG